MKFPLTLFTTRLFVPLAFIAADAGGGSAVVAGLDAKALPFDREVINRYSLDHLPRSLSIRQGEDVWLGFDLERAKLYRVWQAPAKKPGLITAGFVTRSAGTSWFQDKTGETWQLQRAGKTVPLTVRYRGCAQRAGHIELIWELRHDAGVVKLQNRIPATGGAEAGRVQLEVRAEALAAGESLLLPEPARKSWKLTNMTGDAALALTGADWHRLIFP